MSKNRRKKNQKNVKKSESERQIYADSIRGGERDAQNAGDACYSNDECFERPSFGIRQSPVNSIKPRPALKKKKKKEASMIFPCKHQTGASEAHTYRFHPQANLLGNITNLGRGISTDRVPCCVLPRRCRCLMLRQREDPQFQRVIPQPP